MKNCKTTLTSAILLSGIALAHADNPLEEIIVTAEHRDYSISQTATSVSVVTASQLASQSALHVEDVMRRIPNLNAASGASRNRYFQIRGIGERSQYQEPINPSVGLLVDGMDFSGMGLSASTLDIDQVEVLRGPQGTLHGANAIAGLISIQSSEPSHESAHHIELGLGNYQSQSWKLTSTGPLQANLNYRLALGGNTSDGWIKNATLGRADTNNIDEQQARLRLQWQADGYQTDLGIMTVDADNGFDAFSLDNTRTTLSDEPGRDRQKTRAIWLRHQHEFGDYQLNAQVSHSRSDTEYSYDEDWSYVGIAPDWEYSSFDQYQRDHRGQEIDIKLTRTTPNGAWLVGVYSRDNDEELERNYTYLPALFGSRYDTEYRAVYGQIDRDLSASLQAQLGLRYENREARYSDSEALNNQSDDDFIGGKLAFLWQVNDAHRAYLSVSKGYRAGGVNTNVLASIPTAETPEQTALLRGQQVFDEETLWNVELGLRSLWPELGLSWFNTLFVMERDDQQVKGSLVLPRQDGSTNFIDYVNNAASGSNTGLESELVWRAGESLTATAALGLLWAEFDNYINADGQNLSGRDQAQAPRYQYALGLDYQINPQWIFGATMEGRDDYYFSDRHEAKARAIHLLNARVRYQGEQWYVQAWAKNLGDATVTVRGFGSFGNDPRKFYVTEPYYQFGAPRTFGITLGYEL